MIARWLRHSGAVIQAMLGENLKGGTGLYMLGAGHDVLFGCTKNACLERCGERM